MGSGFFVAVSRLGRCTFNQFVQNCMSMLVSGGRAGLSEARQNCQTGQPLPWWRSCCIDFLRLSFSQARPLKVSCTGQRRTFQFLGNFVTSRQQLSASLYSPQSNSTKIILCTFVPRSFLHHDAFVLTHSISLLRFHCHLPILILKFYWCTPACGLRMEGKWGRPSSHLQEPGQHRQQKALPAYATR